MDHDVIQKDYAAISQERPTTQMDRIRTPTVDRLTHMEHWTIHMDRRMTDMDHPTIRVGHAAIHAFHPATHTGCAATHMGHPPIHMGLSLF